MSCYVDLGVDVTKLSQFDKIKEISDLANAILANGVDFGYRKNSIQTTYERESYAFKINKINRSKYIDNIEFFDYNLKRRLVYVYSPYKELQGDAINFELINNTAPMISYTVKLVGDSTYLAKTLEVANNLLDNLAKVYHRKNVIFMQYGNEWLIHKFNITKPYFEKNVKKQYSSFSQICL